MVCAIVVSKYNLEDAKFDPDWHSNQQGWWDNVQGRAWELIEKCTFLHQREDNDVSNYSNLITDVYATITGFTK